MCMFACSSSACLAPRVQNVVGVAPPLPRQEVRLVHLRALHHTAQEERGPELPRRVEVDLEAHSGLKREPLRPSEAPPCGREASRSGSPA